MPLGPCGEVLAPGCLYFLGLLAAVRLLDPARLGPTGLAWAMALVLAGYALLTSGLWAGRRRLGEWVRQSGLPPVAVETLAGPWLVSANVVLAGVVTALALWADFAFARTTTRLAPALAAAAQALSLAWLGRGAARLTLRQGAIVLGAAGAVLVGWALIDPAADPGALHHAVVIAAVLVPLAAFAVLGGMRSLGAGGAWEAAFRLLSPALLAAALLSVVATAGMEAAAFASSGRAAMHPLAVFVMAVAALGAGVTAVRLALASGPDPFGLPERRQGMYVYAAELMLALAFLHVRMTLPHLFGGRLRLYWPVLVMAIAFAGVGIGEALRRRGRAVLGDPVANTGVLLPLVPLLAFWFAQSRVHYSMLLVMVGLLYGLLAVVRGSFRFGLLAALSGNAALWYLLHRTETLGFLLHPQLWVIPAALSVLAAGELNRSVLTTSQLRSLRYACLVGVYVSSTADIFLNGVAHSPWLPLVLAGLSVAGVLVGVMFRIRSFLFLGTGFLALAVVAMIWNAAVNLHWTWLWYVAGILLGLAIIALFALFEKKRDELLALVEGLKAWE